MRKWIKRLFKGAIVLVLLVVLAGISYEQWSRWSAGRSYQPTGTLYEVDGRQVHLHCSGEGASTVVLEAGMDFAGSQSWATIYPDLADGGRVCSYDRAGIMWSEGRDEPRDAVHIVDELHALLAAASEPPPYVMVGHSLGGPLIRMFDHRFPGEVAGFVFVDASHPEQVQRLPSELQDIALPSPLLIKVLSTLGVVRLAAASVVADALPEQAAAAVAAFYPQSLNGVMQTVAADEAIMTQSAETGPLGDRPIVVLTAGRQDPLPPGISQDTWDRMQVIWLELQSELAALSANSDHRIVADATHYVHWDDPEAVVTAVRDVVEAVRSGAAVRAEGG